jgi:RecA-family ATPase
VEIEAHRPALVILDPLASVIRGDENRQQEMSAFTRTLRDLRNKYDCGFCIVHHAKKGKPDEFRGSTVFHASSEVTIRISRLTEDVARSKVTFELKDGESPARMDIQYRQTTGALVPIKASQMLARALAGGDNEREVFYNK